VTLQPAWAIKFEPSSTCNGESVQIVLLLMRIKNPSADIIAAVQQVVTWFKTSEIKNTRIETFAAPALVTSYITSKTDKPVIIYSVATPIWSRYYKVKTHCHFFVTGKVSPFTHLQNKKKSVGTGMPGTHMRHRQC
jgi:PelA/Pel-15E family pectate lyase